MEIKPYPYMDKVEVDILDKLLSELKPKRCLEWGSGGSTLYFPEIHEKYIQLWLSIEHDRNWFDSLNECGYRPTVNLIYKPFPEYITFPEGKFDFILVDGRQRLACLQAIKDKNLLAKNGIIVLHDSGRLRYRKGFDLFDHWEELSPSSNPTEDGGLEDKGLVKFWNN
jgi:predicted O-methyltransferase YrrM